MIYLIGGPGRVGKTTLSRKMLHEKGIPFLSTDMVHDSIMKVMPDFGLNYENDNLERAKRFKPFLIELIHSAHALKMEIGDYLIEGVDILPGTLAEMNDIPFKAVFLGFSEISIDQLLATGSKIDYFRDLSNLEQEKFIQSVLTTSIFLKDECEKYGYQYFDMSEGYDEQMEDAFRFLVT